MNNADTSSKLSGRRATNKKFVRLRLVQIDVFSALRVSFVVSLSLSIIGFVAMFLVYLVLWQTGALQKLDTLVSDVTSQIHLVEIFGFAQVLAGGILVGVLNTIVGTLFGAVGAIIYNMIARVTGGLLVGFTSN